MPDLFLEKHLNHKTEIVKFGSNVELVCLTCSDTLHSEKCLSKYVEEVVLADSCNMEDGCLNCGS